MTDTTKDDTRTDDTTQEGTGDGGGGGSKAGVRFKKVKDDDEAKKQEPSEEM